MEKAAHFVLSSYREELIEHLLLGELMREMWLQGRVIEIARPQVDASGYDLILEYNGIVRHVQLKSSGRNAKTARVPVNVGLAERTGGCVVWVKFNEATMQLGPFLWLGDAQGGHLDLAGFSVGKQTRWSSKGHKADRASIRVVPVRAFEVVATVPQLLVRLFEAEKGHGQDSDALAISPLPSCLSKED